MKQSGCALERVLCIDAWACYILLSIVNNNEQGALSTCQGAIEPISNSVESSLLE